MPDHTAYIKELMELTRQGLKAEGVAVDVIDSFRALVEGRAVYFEFQYPPYVTLTDRQERACCFVALSQSLLKVFDSGTKEELALVEEWTKREREMVIPSAKSTAAGKKNKGREGKLKQIIREVIEDGAENFDQVYAGLEEHPEICDLSDLGLSYENKGKLKTVKVGNVQKAYREIKSK